jgi:protein-S-isoprenylcysteine O-methyltransferase Ste14
MLEAVAFALLWQGFLWQHRFGEHRVREHRPGWQTIPAIGLLIISAVLSWTSVGALGKQWRIDAGLGPDHQLVRSGPYAIVRHPIYASMLALLLGMGLIISPWPLLLSALAFFILGTEIRVRIEDGLLAAHFGDEFAAYKRSKPAYIPGLR